MDTNDNNNVYAPPLARVADQAAEETVISTRPRQIVVALWLMWIALLAPFILRRIFYAATDNKSLMNDSMVFAIMGLNVVIYALISIGLFKGKNWVRITLLVLSILGTLGVLQTFIVEHWFEKLYYSSPFLIFNMAMSQLLTVSTLVLLFTKPGSEWFRRKNT